MMSPARCRCACALLATALSLALVSGESIGSRLDRQYTGYYNQPLTTKEAAANEWKPFEGGACDREMGTPWSIGGARNRENPVMLCVTQPPTAAALHCLSL